VTAGTWLRIGTSEVGEWGTKKERAQSNMNHKCLASGPERSPSSRATTQLIGRTNLEGHGRSSNEEAFH
jgi:hypothetical protein